MLQDIVKAKLADVNPTTFWMGVGISGVVSTAYLTGRASFKAAEILERENLRRIATEMEEKPEPKMTTGEKVKLVWPLYVAPAGLGATTITAIVLSNHTASKKIAALAAATGVSERALQEYKTKVVEKLGENKEQALRDEIAQERVHKDPPPTREVIVAGAGEVLCYDITTGRYFMSTVEKIRQAQNRVNFDIIQHMYASLSSFYDEIGLPPTPMSDEIGWNADNRLEVQFSTVMSSDGRPCVAIDFETPPFVEYSRLW